MSGPQLAFRNVACVRDDHLLFEGMDFLLEGGSAATISGPNGSGKSSLLRLAADLLKPAAGSITRSGKIAWLGEQAALDADLPLRRALGYWATIDGASDETVADALDAMGIAALAEVPVRMLSTGQRRRAGLVRVIAGCARIWLLDEPANGLDTATLARLADVIAAHRVGGGIVMVATHQPISMPGTLAIELGA